MIKLEPFCEPVQFIDCQPAVLADVLTKGVRRTCSCTSAANWPYWAL